MRLVSVLLTVGLLIGCDDAPAADAGVDTGTPTDAGAGVPDTVGPEDRPARLYVPPAHDGVQPLPLVVLLHGYTANSMAQDLYLRMTRTARTEGFYVLLPDGTIDPDGNPYWDVLGLRVDDHAYLRALIEQTLDVVPVDRGSVSLVGHSNGGFMAYRLACDSADLVTSIASLAGSDAVADCTPSDDVAVLQIHGTADSTVSFDGGTIAGLVYPSATETVATWARRSGCDPDSASAGPSLDLVGEVDGDETRTESFANCRAGVSLWTMDGAEHIPGLTAEFTPSVIAWLRDHAR